MMYVLKDKESLEQHRGLLEEYDTKTHFVINRNNNSSQVYRQYDHFERVIFLVPMDCTIFPSDVMVTKLAAQQ